MTGRAATMIALLAAGCSGEIHEERVHVVELTVNGLEDLDEGRYEGWLVFDGRWFSIGTWTSGAGAILATAHDPLAADQIAVTVEPTTDSDPTPSWIVALAGDIAGDVTRMTFPGAPVTQACGVRLREGGASFALELVLPDLPLGFVWEGWIVRDGRPRSTGRFSDPGPPYPEGRAEPGVDLADGMTTVVLTVEPDLDGVDPTGPGPFALKPLAAPIPRDQSEDAIVPLDLGPNATAFGTAVADGPRGRAALGGR